MNTKSLHLIVVLSILFCLNAEAQVKAEFSTNDTIVCAGEIISFTNSSANADRYTWYIDDDKISSTSSAQFATSGSKTFVVRLIASNFAGTDTDTAMMCVRSIAKPSANFSFDQYTNSGFYCLNTLFTINGWSNFSGFESIKWDFDDGFQSTSLFPKHQYSSPGTYKVKLTTTNQCGTADYTSTIEVVNDSKARPDLNIMAPKQVCPGQQFTMYVSDNGSDSTVTSMGDGNTTLLTDFEYVFKEKGVYTISSKASGQCGVNETTHSIEVTDTVHVMPQVYPSRRVICKREEFFASASLGKNDIAYVNYGDGATDTLTYEDNYKMHTYNAEGTYTFKAYLKPECGLSDTITSNIEVLETREANQYSIYLSSYYYCLGEQIAFYTPYLEEFSSFRIDFGDGTIKTIDFTENNYVTHTYAKAGSYSVQTRYTNACGSKKTYDFSVYVGNYGLNPQLSIEYPSNQDMMNCITDTMTFRVDAGGRAVKSAHWKFKDGMTYNGVSMKRTFDKVGSYTVLCTIQDICDRTYYRAITVDITDKIMVPKANFWAYPATDCINTEVLFDNVTSNASSMIWDFGDGIRMENDPQMIHTFHTYTKAGIYYPKLIASNGCGTDSLIQEFRAVEGPEVGFTASSVAASQGDTIFFTNTTKDALEGHWRIDDKLYHEGLDDISFVTSDIGPHTIELWAKNYFSCWDVFQMDITVGGVNLEPPLRHDINWVAYPNPTAGLLHLRNSDGSAPVVRVRLIDNNGRVLIQEIMQTNYTLNLNKADIPNGLYYLIVEDGNKQFSNRISLWR